MFSEVDYSPEAQILTVTWLRNGTTTNYHAVPAAVWEAAKQAESIGKFYNSEIKGKYETDHNIAHENVN